MTRKIAVSRNSLLKQSIATQLTMLLQGCAQFHRTSQRSLPYTIRGHIICAVPLCQPQLPSRLADHPVHPGGTKYLVDTCAFCSVFPASRHGTCTIDTESLTRYVLHSSIPSHGTRDILLHFGGRTYTWNFCLAQVTQPLLGADFLAHHHLLVEIAAQRIITPDTFVPTLLHSGPTSPAFSLSSIAEQPFQSFIMEYADVFKPELHQQQHSATKLPKHGTHHHRSSCVFPLSPP